MEKKYQINGYQLIYTDGQRDSIKLLSPEMVDDIEEYRESVKREHQCMLISLIQRFLNSNHFFINQKPFRKVVPLKVRVK